MDQGVRNPVSLIPGATTVFSDEQVSKGCVLVFLATDVRAGARSYSRDDADRITKLLEAFRSEGWKLSVREMFEADDAAEPTAFATGFSYGADFVGVFEAPTISAALEGSVRLERAGWGRRFATEWLIGPRELTTVEAAGPHVDRPWILLALWEWNDARTAATPAERRQNDQDCDVAFRNDLECNVNMSGRHRLDWAHAWQHLSIWEATDPSLIDRLMYEHERVLDFRFSTSRHIIGRRRNLIELLQP
jgi:hypothetical protein